MKKQYNGLDMLKFTMALLIAARHLIQLFYPPDSLLQFIISRWLSNLGVPIFFTAAGFFLFSRIDGSLNTRTTDKKTILAYCKRILILYLIWSALYLPYNWSNRFSYGQSPKEMLGTYLHWTVFSSTVVQLWYLPALAAACFFVWFLYSRGMKIWQLLLLTGLLFGIGCVCDNWFFNQHLPEILKHLLRLYYKYFLTARNGVFYGSFFICLGLWFAKSKKQFSPLSAFLPALFFIGLMSAEVKYCFNTNMIFSSVPAVFFLFAAAVSVSWKDNSIYKRLREMSEWIYLSHTYFFFLFSLAAFCHLPVPGGSFGAFIMMGTILLFAWGMTRLSEYQKCKWLKKMI